MIRYDRPYIERIEIIIYIYLYLYYVFGFGSLLNLGRFADIGRAIYSSPTVVANANEFIARAVAAAIARASQLIGPEIGQEYVVSVFSMSHSSIYIDLL